MAFRRLFLLTILLPSFLFLFFFWFYFSFQKKQSEELVKTGLKNFTAATTRNTNEFKSQCEGKVEEVVLQLDRTVSRAKEGQEKLKTTKASVIEAIELNREKLKRVLKQLKEHEKEVIAMRDVHLKQTSEKELSRATASIEEKLVQVSISTPHIHYHTTKLKFSYYHDENIDRAHSDLL